MSLVPKWRQTGMQITSSLTNNIILLELPKVFLDGQEIAQVESQNRCRTQEMAGRGHTSELPGWKDVSWKVCTRYLEHIHSSWSFKVSIVMIIQCPTNRGYFLFKFCPPSPPPSPPKNTPKFWWFQRHIIRAHHRVVIQLLIPADCLICLDHYIIFFIVHLLISLVVLICVYFLA